MARWINSLSDSLDQSVEDPTKQEILEGTELFNDQITPVKKAEMVRKVMLKMDALIEQPQRAAILEYCGRQCLGKSVVQKARLLKRASSNLDDFLGQMNENNLGGGMLENEGNFILATYAKCYCGNVSRARWKISGEYCNCSRGWLLELFEKSLGVPVRVEFLHTIVQGAENCQFRITPEKEVEW
jgi:predicted hydrocarbon binding protein